MECREEYALKWEKKFKHLAGGWVRLPEQLHGHPDREWLHKNVEEPVLDVACGSSVDGEFFRDYVGLDVTRSFCLSSHHVHEVANIVCGDGRRLPFKTKSFKTVFSKDLLLHLPLGDCKQVLDEMLRVGEVVYVAWGISYHDFTFPKVFLPSDAKAEKHVLAGFEYNRFAVKDFAEYVLIHVSPETTITQIQPA
jgi:hypothetical protein